MCKVSATEKLKNSKGQKEKNQESGTKRHVSLNVSPANNSQRKEVLN